jgi:hypothetical protein
VRGLLGGGNNKVADAAPLNFGGPAGVRSRAMEEQPELPLPPPPLPATRT